MYTPTGCGLVMPTRIEGWWCNPLPPVGVLVIARGGGGGGGGTERLPPGLPSPLEAIPDEDEGNADEGIRP